MTSIDRFERELPAALGDVAGARPPDYLVNVLGRTARTRQRPAWASIGRWLPMDLASSRVTTARFPWRTVGVLALVALLLAALLAVNAGSQRRVPAPYGPAVNGLIPFERDGDILVGDPDTGETRLLSGGSANDYLPMFSPDGTRVAFLRAGADCPAPGDDCPGGELVVVAGADGSGLEAISPAPIVGIGAITWAADSRSLYLGRGEEILRLPIDGSGPTVLRSDAQVDWIVPRPPAGDELLVRGFVDGVFGLHRMKADGSDAELLVEATFSGFDDNQDLNFPAYSPDGATIYHNRSNRGTIEAWAMDADGSNARRFNVDAPVAGWWEGEMAPSPDGRWVAMWRVAPGMPGRITVYPADGTGEGVEGPFIAGTAHWAWAPDSSRILVNYNNPDEGDQVLLDPRTGKVTPLPWAADAEPDWQRLAP
ncbi:MAG TPA: hypothetical protein VFY23_04535 [Candidatus Limnocylindrales bacterium]|nr:hypothetical protein [Candidatus Limnocylindrales bacterium]